MWVKQSNQEFNTNSHHETFAVETDTVSAALSLASDGRLVGLGKGGLFFVAVVFLVLAFLSRQDIVAFLSQTWTVGP